MKEETIMKLKKGDGFTVLLPKSKFITLPIASGEYEIIQTEMHDRGRSLEFYFYEVQVQRTNSKILSCRQDTLIEIDKLGLLAQNT